MPRPKKCRFVGVEPDVKIFKPAGIPTSELEVLSMTLDELESIRLADLLGNSHEQAAEKMRVSRATFGRILESGRMKVANALVNGKVIMIEPGDFCNQEVWIKRNDCEFCKRKGFNHG